MGMWSLGNGKYYDTSKQLQEQTCFNFVNDQLNQFGIVVASDELDGQLRAKQIDIDLGQVSISEFRSYLHNDDDINTFFQLAGINYTVKYNG